MHHNGLQMEKQYTKNMKVKGNLEAYPKLFFFCTDSGRQSGPGTNTHERLQSID